MVDYLALAMYSAWLGPKREQIKLIFQLYFGKAEQDESASAGLPKGDLPLFVCSMRAPQPSQPANKCRCAGREMEAAVQEWERQCLLRTLTDLWVGLLAGSESAWNAANATSISGLTPIQEYTSAVSETQTAHRQGQLGTLTAGQLLTGPWVQAAASSSCWTTTAS